MESTTIRGEALGSDIDIHAAIALVHCHCTYEILLSTCLSIHLDVSADNQC